MRRVINRRRFLGSTLAVSLAASATSLAAKEPPIRNPRATDGDARYEPDWDEKLTITVGVKKADLVGTNDRVLQAAVDYVHRLGGGTVHVQPGTYTLRNAVHMPSGIRMMTIASIFCVSSTTRSSLLTWRTTIS